MAIGAIDVLELDCVSSLRKRALKIEQIRFHHCLSLHLYVPRNLVKLLAQLQAPCSST